MELTGSAPGHYYGHPVVFYDVLAAYAAFAAATSSQCELPRPKKRKLETAATSNPAASADTSRLIVDRRGHVTFRPYSDSLDTPRKALLVETQTTLSRSRAGLTGYLPASKSQEGLSSSRLCEDKKVQHLECTIGNLFPEILSTIFCYLDVPSKGRAAQVMESSCVHTYLPTHVCTNIYSCLLRPLVGCEA
jgi:hypothetical protein